MGTAPPDRVGQLLFGSTRREVLALLFGRPGEKFYLREILRAAGAGSGGVQRELKQLTEAELINREAAGRQVYFSANQDAPIFTELQSILNKTAGTADVVRTALAPLLASGAIKLAFIYGSVASGRQTSNSDIDLLVVGDLALADVVPALRTAESRLGREINVSVYGRKDLKQKIREDAPFIRRVLAAPKQFVIGDDRVLGRLAR